MTGTRPPAAPRPDVRRDFWRGFRRILPLWIGMAPFGLAYAVTARGAGLTLGETQLMSLLVFSGGAQFSAAGLFAAGAGPLSLVATTFLINVRHLLYGLSLARGLRLDRARRLVAAYFLTDEAFGVTVSGRESTFAALLGAELSVFAVWNASTLVGSLASDAVPDPAALGVDFVFPLAFLALLIPLLARRVDLLVAALAGGAALAASRVLDAGLTVLVSAVSAALVGAALTRPTPAGPSAAGRGA